MGWVFPGGSRKVSSPAKPPTISAGQAPALETVAQAVESVSELQEQRTDAVDTKAGVILGFAGLLATISPPHMNAGRLLALSLDGLAAVLAGVALIPRPFPLLNPSRIRNYVTWSEEQAGLRLLDTRIEMYEKARSRSAAKSRWLVYSAGCLVGAVIATVIAAAVG